MSSTLLSILDPKQNLVLAFYLIKIMSHQNKLHLVQYFLPF